MDIGKFFNNDILLDIFKIKREEYKMELLRMLFIGFAGIVIGSTAGYIGGFDRGYKKGYEWACKKEIAKADMEGKEC